VAIATAARHDDALASRQHDEEVQLYAFDCLVLGDEDLRSPRRANRCPRMSAFIRRQPGLARPPVSLLPSS
jgi:ATP-dependent DNA ligase